MTEANYEQALERLNEIFDAKPNTPKGDELELLALLIDNYETEHYPIEPPHPIEAIKFRMDQMGAFEETALSEEDALENTHSFIAAAEEKEELKKLIADPSVEKIYNMKPKEEGTRSATLVLRKMLEDMTPEKKEEWHKNLEREVKEAQKKQPKGYNGVTFL